MEGPGRPNQSLIFQTGSGRPVLISKGSVERSRALLMDEDAEIIGKILRLVYVFGSLQFSKFNHDNKCLLCVKDNGILAASSQFCKQDLEGLLLWNRVQLKRQAQFWRMEILKEVVKTLIQAYYLLIYLLHKIHQIYFPL